MCCSLFLEADFLVRAQARIDHQRKIERLLRFGFKYFDFLKHAFLIDLECLEGQIRRGLAVIIQDAGQNIYQFHFDFDLAALRIGVVKRSKWLLRRWYDTTGRRGRWRWQRWRYWSWGIGGGRIGRQLGLRLCPRWPVWLVLSKREPGHK